MRRPSYCLIVLLWAATLFTGGCVLAPGGPQRPVVIPAELRAAHNLKVFDRAWTVVNEKFFDPNFRGVKWAAIRERYSADVQKAADDEALYTVINTMLAELKESHVGALTPQGWYEEHTEQRALIGIAFEHLEERWVVINVFPDSPAAESGVRPGWLVTARDGQPLDGQRFRLENGETVVYEFLDRQDRPRALTMTARVMSMAFPPEVRELTDGVVYLRFDHFNFSSLRWLSAQLRAHREAPAVIIDLRQNPGGYRYSLDFALGEFFPKAVPMGTYIRRNGSKNEEAASQWFSARYAGRVVLLVGPNSASCSEIFAHVLHHHGRATLVGQTTAGAVIASLIGGLPDRGRLQVPVEDYIGLHGQRLEGVGVTPDITVPHTLADLRAGIDPELTAALAYLRGERAALALTR